MTTIARAAQALAAVRPGITGVRRQMMMGQAYAESRFGDGFAKNNWGAIYATGTCGTVPVQDTYEGKPVTMGAACNDTPEDGALQFASLIQGSYPQAYEAAGDGNTWNYARGLWRKGPNSSSPPYYGGFPPGHKWSLAPKGTKRGSDLDYYYRILAYAQFVLGGAQAVAKGLGEPVHVFLHAPPPPKSNKSGIKSKSSGGGDMLLLPILGAGLYFGAKALRA